MSSTSDLAYCSGRLVMTDIRVCHNTKPKAITVSLRLVVQLGWRGIGGIQRPCEGLSAFASRSHGVWWLHPGKLHLTVQAVAQSCPGAPPAPHSLCRRQLHVTGQPLPSSTCLLGPLSHSRPQGAGHSAGWREESWHLDAKAAGPLFPLHEQRGYVITAALPLYRRIYKW